MGTTYWGSAQRLTMNNTRLLISLTFIGLCLLIIFSGSLEDRLAAADSTAESRNSSDWVFWRSAGLADGHHPYPESLAAGLHRSVTQELLQDFLRFVAGGCLGLWLWPRLLGYTPIYLQNSGCWPPGLLDLTAAFALGYLVYHLINRRPQKTELPPPTPDFLAPLIIQPVQITVSPPAAPGLASLQARNPDFNLTAFGDFVRQTIKTLYTHWNQGDLQKLEGLLSEDLLNFLRMAQHILTLRGEIHRLENLSLKQLIISEAGADETMDFVVVCVKGRLIDYVLQRHTLKLLAGSMTYPKEWEEFWRFERPHGKKAWLLTDIKEF